jgi:hypothetical protein
MPPLNEQAQRRAEFAGGVPVQLGDGQEWTLPKPGLLLRPEFGPDGRPTFGKARPSWGEDYEAKVDAFLEATDGYDQIVALLVLAVDLLMRNYSLDDGAIGQLLPRILGDEANDAMWEAVRDVALGVGPKATPAGSAALS